MLYLEWSGMGGEMTGISKGENKWLAQLRTKTVQHITFFLSFQNSEFLVSLSEWRFAR